MLALGKAFAQGEPTGGKSTVVRVLRPEAFANWELPQQTVTDMVHTAVKRLAGEDDLRAAWLKFVGPDDVVGLKINCLFGPGASTHMEVVQAVIAGCRAVGVPPEHIIVWDRTTGDMTKTGYPVVREGEGVRFYGTDGFYEPNASVEGSFNGRLSQILTRTTTALINLPVLKTHGTSGITGALKNHYGSFHNPASHHDNYCDPFIADVNSLPVIREKTRLIVMDALLPIAEGGPAAKPAMTWPYGGILAATDPVAIDFLGLQILEARRQAIGLGPIGQQARHIATAAAKGVGTNDPARIDLIELS